MTRWKPIEKALTADARALHDLDVPHALIDSL